jgi:Tfp pilus assembly protein PilP
MGRALKMSLVLVVAAFVSSAGWRIIAAQEDVQTPSQKTKDAVDKFNAAPAAIGKALQGLKEAARAKLQQTLGGKREPDANPDSSDPSLPKTKDGSAGTERFSPAGKRDPFRPATLDSKASSQRRQNLSPLERFELGQLKVVGIVWDIKEPRAMIEDTAGFGYIVKVGTPIGSGEGRVKGIYRSEVVVEESYADFYGNKRKRDISMKLPTE